MREPTTAARRGALMAALALLVLAGAASAAPSARFRPLAAGLHALTTGPAAGAGEGAALPAALVDLSTGAVRSLPCTLGGGLAADGGGVPHLDGTGAALSGDGWLAMVPCYAVAEGARLDADTAPRVVAALGVAGGAARATGACR